MKKEITICYDYNHEDIVYTGRECPLCIALKEIKDLTQRIEELESPNPQ